MAELLGPRPKRGHARRGKKAKINSDFYKRAKSGDKEAKAFIKKMEEREKQRESIKASKMPIKKVKIRKMKDVPRSVSKQTREYIKENPKVRNPYTNRDRQWTYLKYPSIIPPTPPIRKVGRKPKPALVGNAKPTRKDVESVKTRNPRSNVNTLERVVQKKK